MSMVKTIGYYMDNHEQGVFPPNNYLTPILDENEHLPDWCKEFKVYFNDLIYTYYYDRVVLQDGRFDTDSETTNYNNLRHVIANILNSRQYEFSNLYNSTILEFNPLWNVDGVETTERYLSQTGTDTNAKTGNDSLVDSGSDVTTDQQTTYDTSFLDTEKSTLTHGKTATQNYGSTNTETKNLLDSETITLERHGNIGVTTTTKLLTEYREYSTFDLWKYITHEIITQITYGID